MLLHAIEQIGRTAWFKKITENGTSRQVVLRLYHMRPEHDEKGKLHVRPEPIDEEYELDSAGGFYHRAEQDPSNRQANSLKVFRAASDVETVNWPFFGAASLFRNGFPNTVSWTAFAQGLLAAPVFRKWCEEQEVTPEVPATFDQDDKATFHSLEEDGVWALPILGRSSEGYLVLGVSDGAGEAATEDLRGTGANVDWRRSFDLIRTLRELPAGALADVTLQMSSGLGFNPFGKGDVPGKELDAFPSNERERLIGYEPDVAAGVLPVVRAEVWNRLYFPIRAGSHADDFPRLLFFPEDANFLELVENSLEFQRRLRIKKKADEADELVAHRPDILPEEASRIDCTVLLAVQTGGNKPKLFVEQAFHPVNFEYWRLINAFNAKPLPARGSLPFDFLCQEVGRWIIGGNEKFPSAKRLWTNVLGSLLNRRSLSARQVFSKAQAAFKSCSSDEIRSGKSKRGRTTPTAVFRDLLEALPQANGLIQLANTLNPRELSEAFPNLKPKPLMETSIENPNPEILLGEAYTNAPWAVQNKVDRLLRATGNSVPQNDVEDYIWGAYCGGWLAYFEYTVEQLRASGLQRKFDALGGTHPTKLRGPRLVERAGCACALLRDIQAFEERKRQGPSAKTRAFIETAKYLVDCQQRSRRASFNTGFCLGLVEYNDKAPPGKGGKHTSGNSD